ncbi:hypothetical protein R1flu_005518 [Riccia fluitans]|uniref:Uncharacterized protein n=1 Tax=Riccia fluitans TaxID=41844 RepID=A0ABD1YTE5_9MARC
MFSLAVLAGCKSFLNVMQDPRSFTILVNLFQIRQSTTAVSAGCTCLTIAVTNFVDCMKLAELHTSPLVNKLLSLWCESRKAEVKFQALASRVNVAILCLSLQENQDTGSFSSTQSEVLASGEALVLIDDNQFLVGNARAYGTFEGFSIMQQPKLFEHYSMLVPEKAKK